MLIRFVVVHHGTGNKRLRILFVRDGKQIECADDAFGRYFHIVIHEQDVGDITFFESLDHAVGEAAGSADIVVREDGDILGTQFLRIESASVVDDIHAEML